MKYKLTSILNSVDFYQSYLWTVRFENKDPNILDTGMESVNNKIIPAQSVTESFVTVTYDEVGVGNGITVPFPKRVSHYGTVAISFYDAGGNRSQSDLLKINQFLKDWISKDLHDHNYFKKISKTDKDTAIKRIYIDKYTKKDDNAIYSSSYDVYPPDTLTFSGGSDHTCTTTDVTFKIAKVHQIHESP